MLTEHRPPPAPPDGAEVEPGTSRALDLDEAVQKQVEQRLAPPATVVYETIRREGEDELRRPSEALAWSGIAAGLSMGFSLVAMGLLRSHLPDAPWRPLVANLGYCIGFLLAILGRQQLFTENTLTPILPLLSPGSKVPVRNVLRLWGIVLATNLVGALIFAWVIANTPIFSPDVHQAFREIGDEAVRNQGWTALLKAVFAGWLIALMVWVLPYAETARVAVIIIITYVVGLSGLTHVVAGSIEVFYMGLTGAAPWTAVLGGYLLPTLVGNVLGGVTLVTVLNHAQVVSGKREAGRA